MQVYADRIDEDLKEIELPEWSQEDIEFMKEKFYARIRED